MHLLAYSPGDKTGASVRQIDILRGFNVKCKQENSSGGFAFLAQPAMKGLIISTIMEKYLIRLFILLS